MIKLKEFEKEDISKLISWISSKEFLLQWGGSTYEFPLTEYQLLQDIELRDKSKILMCKVTLEDTEETIGHIQLRNIDHKNKSSIIGRVLVGDKENRNKGIGCEMVNRILRIAFNDLKLHRVSLGVFDFNDAAINCYKKAGFQIEGKFREAEKIDDKYWSLVIMSIIEDKYRVKYN